MGGEVGSGQKKLGVPVAAKGEKGCTGSSPERAQGTKRGGGQVSSEKMKLKSLSLEMSLPVTGMQRPQAGQDLGAHGRTETYQNCWALEALGCSTANGHKMAIEH